MGLDQISLERLALVHPTLAARVQSLVSQLDFPLRVTQGKRTVAEQNVLYAQGRTTPGPIVTNARGAESWHVLACAVDVVPMDLEDGDPDWNENSPSWKRIVALAPACGLRSGISWKDEPHLQLIELPETPTGEQQQVFVDAGVEGVWQEIAV